MLSLNEVQIAIRNAGLDWEAGNTPIGSDFIKGNTRHFGLSSKGKEPKSRGSGRLATQAFAFVGKEPPSFVDWRHIDGADYVSQVLDQGTCGACVAFATCAVIESRAKISKQDPHHPIQLSKAHLFFCGTKNGCEEGWAPNLALQRCKDVGIGDEKEYRYQPKQLPCHEIKSIVRVPRWKRCDSLVERRNAIWLRGPVIACMVVYSDFLWYKDGI